MLYNDVHLLAGTRDLTGEANQIEVTMGEPIHEHAPFGNEGVQRALGLPADAYKVMAVLAPDSGDGSWDKRLRKMLDDFRSAEMPIMASIETNPGQAGDLCLFSRTAGANQIAETIKAGELRRIEFTSPSLGPIVTGKLLHVGQIDSASGEGDAVTLPAVPEGKKVAALLLGYEAASGELDVSIESSSDAGFTSPTLRFSFATLDAVGHEWLTLTAGSVGIAETHWRITWTGASSPELFLGVAIGVI